MRSPSADGFDYVLVGGGLQNGLIALALLSRHPDCRIAIVERGSRLGGNHIWCFHERDLPDAAAAWVEPLVCHRWPGYRVRFPRLVRQVAECYSAITSRRFHEVVTAALEKSPGNRVLLGSEAEVVGSRAVQLSTGEQLFASVVVDSRGPQALPSSRCGFQKFLGIEVRLARPHGLDLPVLMDATVDQTEGFRFHYILPLSSDGLLFEDTYFHERAELNQDQIRVDILHSMEKRGYDVAEVIREELGVLPMPWAGWLPEADRSPLRAGYQGGWFHPGTGYSFPIACRLALLIASQRPGEVREGELAALAREHRRQVRFCHFLNDFLFRWYPPQDRWNIFERFYRLPEETISRFYSLRLTLGDRIRLLAGRPPSGLSLRYRLRSGG